MQRFNQIADRALIAGALLLGAAFSSAARAAVINPPLNQFVLTNTSADGSKVIANDGLSLMLTGGNTGSGLPGTTDLTVSSPNVGTVEFHYSYTTLDLPGFDSAGYILGSIRFPLADTDGESGIASFSVNVGQTYGWYVSTQDNTGEPGLITVTFTPTAVTVPEPGGFVFALAGIALLAMNRRVSVPIHLEEGKDS